MSRNVEIKAGYDDLERGKGIAERLGARLKGADRQVDTYFRVPGGRLKIRESSLSGGELIPYFRADRSDPKTCEYAVIPLPDPGKAIALFRNILGISGVVKKTRTIYLLDNVRIHLDQVEGLGSFIEFEAVCRDDSAEEIARNEGQVSRLIETFGIRPGDLVKGSYQEMI